MMLWYYGNLTQTVTTECEGSYGDRTSSRGVKRLPCQTTGIETMTASRARDILLGWFMLSTLICHPTQAVEGERSAKASPETRAKFAQLVEANWREVCSDPCTGNWRESWFLDGEIGTVTNTPQGMELRAGPEFRNDAHHMVLWTKEQFSGDLKIDYEYTRLDSETRCVTILYVQATGSGTDPYAKDILDWAELRKVPSMKMYFNHMNTYHISYAAYPNADDATEDYIRARRYMPEAKGLRGTDLAPDYFRTGLFATGVPHKITVIKHEQELFMLVRNDEKQMLCHWKNEVFPPIVEGRIGLRHMYTRSARYRDFRISVPRK